MAIAQRPESIVALRARHEALRIAEAIFRGSGVDVEQLNCHACGAELDWRDAHQQVCIDCPSCGAVNELPCHLRYRVPPGDEQAGTLDYASVEPDRRHWWNDAIPVAQSVDVMQSPRSPRWLNVFCLACLAIVLIALLLMLLRTRL